MRAYIGLIHKDDTSDFGVSFPDLPGCISAGRTLDEAEAMAAEALALHLAGLEEDGTACPEPSSRAAITALADHRDAVTVVVPAPHPAPPVIARPSSPTP
ncbi:type II toxin-antitoxin system HicB family antitoxin [Salinarimonas rosea]|uniref:type II toxin-antitoxin system HicB family antitoxin n=1 Tax=Salinarimonas rosea TaxID=552063 RepID=UPI000406CF69